MFPGYNSDNPVTTTLSSAIDFVMALELREQNAFPESHRDPSIVDERIEDLGTNTEKAQCRGYTGSEIREPSTSWVKLAEGEKVMPPATPLVLNRRCRPDVQPPGLAHYRTLIEKKKSNPAQDSEFLRRIKCLFWRRQCQRREIRSHASQDQQAKH